MHSTELVSHRVRMSEKLRFRISPYEKFYGDFQSQNWKVCRMLIFISPRFVALFIALLLSWGIAINFLPLKHLPSNLNIVSGSSIFIFQVSTFLFRLCFDQELVEGDAVASSEFPDWIRFLPASTGFWFSSFCDFFLLFPCFEDLVFFENRRVIDVAEASMYL